MIEQKCWLRGARYMLKSRPYISPPCLGSLPIANDPWSILIGLRARCPILLDHCSLTMIHDPLPLAVGSLLVDHDPWSILIGSWIMAHCPWSMIHCDWLDHVTLLSLLGRGCSPLCFHPRRLPAVNPCLVRALVHEEHLDWLLVTYRDLDTVEEVT